MRADPHSYTIIDEADELISPDWEEDIGRIMSGGGMKACVLAAGCD